MARAREIDDDVCAEAYLIRREERLGWQLIVRRLGLRVGHMRLRDCVRSYAERAGLSMAPFSQMRVVGGTRIWNDGDTAELRRLAAGGLNITAIAQVMQRGHNTLREKAELYGVTFATVSARPKADDTAPWKSTVTPGVSYPDGFRFDNIAPGTREPRSAPCGRLPRFIGGYVPSASSAMWAVTQ